jgi:hypothetical protein
MWDPAVEPCEGNLTAATLGGDTLIDAGPAATEGRQSGDTLNDAGPAARRRPPEW